MRVNEILVIFGTWYLLFADHDWFLASVVALMLGVLIFVTRSIMKAERNIRRLEEQNSDRQVRRDKEVKRAQVNEQQRRDMNDAT